MTTLGAVVTQAARRFGSRPAVVAPDGWELTYAQLDRLSDEVAVGLLRRGVGRGDVVAIALPSSPDYLAAYVGAAKAGAVTAGINPRLSPLQRAALVRVAVPRLLIGTEDLLDGVAADVADAAVVRLAAGASTCLAPLRDGTATPARPAPPTMDDLVAIVFTSGTSGTPKGAVFTHRHLDAIRRLDVGERSGGGGAMLASTELVHVGVMTKLGWYLRTGATLHLLRRWRAADALRVIAEQRIASVGAIAPQIALMLRQPDFADYDLSAVTTIVAGGAPSPPDLVSEARRRFEATYSIRYSSTESGGVGTATAVDAPDAEALHTVGRPRPGVELQLRDDDGAPTPTGEIGTVWLRSPAVMAGYWRDPQASAHTLVDGWLRTGDLGGLDGAGCLRLAGRAGDAFIRGGYNVHPETVEAVLRRHPDVLDVAVTPRPDVVLGEIGVAVVVPVDPQHPVTLEALRAAAGEALAHHELPQALVLVDDLPRTALHKLDRRRLRAVVGAEADSEMPGRT